MALTTKQLRQRVIEAVRAGAPIAPRCPHAPPPGQCGGCTFQDRAYADQVAAKRAALRDLWAADLPAERLEQVEMVASPEPFAYRTRMDYIASKERFGLRRRGKFNYIVDLSECHLIPPVAFQAARAVYERAVALGLPDYDLRTHAGYLRYIVVRRSPQDALLLAAVTASRDHADEMATLAAHALAQPAVVGFHWLLNDTLTDLSFGTPLQHWGAATLPMQVGRRTLAIGPNSFFQNNLYLLLPLLDAVQAAVCGQRPIASSEDQGSAGLPNVADLYGGVGTIALHLADRAAHVVCVEASHESAALARQNIAANQVANVTVVAADVLAFLRSQPAGRFDVIVADPPRTGLGPEVCRELLRLRPARLVYVSCNPLTQLADARALGAGYRLAALRGYDMFPQTPHMEALAVFERVI
jgi:23S rRNA (uracil-5-)-methyltransferase RumA